MCPSLHEMFPWYLILLKRSLVFPILLFSYISLHWSLRKAFLSLLAILWNTAFRCLYLSFSPLLFTSLIFTAICKASSAILLFCISFSCEWSWSLSPIQCHEPLSIVHQALCLPDLVPWIYLSLPLYNRKGVDLGQKVMTNLDSIFKSRDTTLPTKVRLVKAMVFPVVMYRCESCRRIDAFELWCWKRLLRVP